VPAAISLVLNCASVLNTKSPKCGKGTRNEDSHSKFIIPPASRVPRMKVGLESDKKP